MKKRGSRPPSLERALALCGQGQLPEAEALLRDYVKLHPHNAHALHALAYVRHGRGDWPEAARFAGAALKLEPGRKMSHQLLGLINERMGRKARALRHWKLELRRDPWCKYALLKAGLVHFEAGNLKTALGYLSRCHALNHARGEIFRPLVVCHWRVSQPEQVKLLCEQRLLTHPDDAWAWQNLGATLIGGDQNNRAILHLMKAQALDPADPACRRHLERALTYRNHAINKPSKPPLS